MIEEVKKRFDVRYELRDLDLDTLMESFPTVLLKAEIDSTLVLVLDNLDLLTKDGEPYHELDWFPRTFPARCRLIVSCGEGKLLLNIRFRCHRPLLSVRADADFCTMQEEPSPIWWKR